MAPFVEFMGYTQPWYSVRGVEASLLAEEGHIICYLRDGDRVFLTYSTTGRGNEPADGSMGLLDMTPYGRARRGRTTRRAGPRPPTPAHRPVAHAPPICWYWRTDANGIATWGPTGRPTPQWHARRVPRWRPSAAKTTTTDAGSFGLDVAPRHGWCDESMPGRQRANDTSPCSMRTKVLSRIQFPELTKRPPSRLTSSERWV